MISLVTVACGSSEDDGATLGAINEAKRVADAAQGAAIAAETAASAAEQASLAAQDDTSAVASEAAQAAVEKAQAAAETAATAVAPPSYVTITHYLGTDTVPVNPETIVVFDLGVLLSLHDLGVEVDAVGGLGTPIPSEYESIVNNPIR